MPKGYSLHIGLNSVDPNHYGGWSGELNACEYDAEDMCSIATQRNFSASKLLTRNAKKGAITKGLNDLASKAKEGDLVLITYSGHGAQKPDYNQDESDGLDETWCLYDEELLDDELHDYFCKFEKGVRVLVISDSCHSGTVIRSTLRGQLAPSFQESSDGNKYAAKMMDLAVANRVYRANKSHYDKLQARFKNRGQLGATVKLISGCQDNQYSYDGPFNGAFTGTLLRVWNNGLFNGNYKQFHLSIVGLMPHYQTPNHFTIGAYNSEFEAQHPFEI